MIDNITSDIIEADWLKFSAKKIRDAKVVWADYAYFETDAKWASRDELDQQILSENAYVIPDTPCFASVDFDHDDEKILIAERYGGAGIGINGGGGRCGNTDRFQLKGIGKNCLVGQHDNLEHSYGGLDARKAILETIYAGVLGKVLPHGAVQIRALILVGETTGLSGNKPCWGVIMVRDKCLRLAHWMRAAEFQPGAACQAKLAGDVARVRRISKRLAALAPEHFEIMAFLKRFLDNSASQFAFARAARILHGTLSPSNVSVEGKWLDMPLASFLNGGKNYTLTSEFYGEHLLALNYALELHYLYSKYGGAQSDPKELTEYYRDQFIFYFRQHVGYIFGFDEASVAALNADDWKLVVSTFGKIVHAGKSVCIRRSYPDDKDPVVSLITASFLALGGGESAHAYFAAAGIGRRESEEYSNCFRRVMLGVAETKAGSRNGQAVQIRVTRTALFALRVAHLSAAFYLPAVDGQVSDLCENGTPCDISSLISKYREAADWIFEQCASQTTLFKSISMVIYFAHDDGRFVIERGRELSSFSRYGDFLQFLRECDRGDFRLMGFDFFALFEKLDRFFREGGGSLAGMVAHG